MREQRTNRVSEGTSLFSPASIRSLSRSLAEVEQVREAQRDFETAPSRGARWNCERRVGRATPRNKNREREGGRNGDCMVVVKSVIAPLTGSYLMQTASESDTYAYVPAQVSPHQHPGRAVKRLEKSRRRKIQSVISAATGELAVTCKPVCTMHAASLLPSCK